MENKALTQITIDNELGAFWTSIDTTKEENVKKLYSIMVGAEKRLGDYINSTIKVKDIYTEVVECKNEQTGEREKQPRIVVIDVNGETYGCVSRGIFSAIRKLVGLLGCPPWNDGVALKIKQVSTKNGRKMLTFEMV